MADNSKIEWTTHTFNPWWGCTKVSPECENCYAETGAIRYGWSESGKHFPIWGKDAHRRFFGTEHWQQPHKWDKQAIIAGERHRVFCASFGDILEDRDDLLEPRVKLVRLIDNCLHLDWLLLTKRPQNFTRLFPWGDPYPHNVWAMTTVGCKSSLWRADALREVPAVVRGLSCEPLLEDLGKINLSGIHWVIVGGESGHGARPLNIAWIRSIISQCRDAGVACFVKQMGAKPYEVHTADDCLLGPFDLNGEKWLSLELYDRKGGDMDEWPEDLRVREFPKEGQHE